MKKQPARLILILTVVLFILTILADRLYVSKLKEEFLKLEKERIETSNKLTTAKILQENLNHVRDLIFENMDFPNQPDTLQHETHVFNFITDCINDLKLKLISVKPLAPVQADLITTYGYEIEVQGDFFKFGELCSKFENSRRIFSLETYEVALINTIEKTTGSPQGTTISVKMLVNTYRVKKDDKLIAKDANP